MQYLIVPTIVVVLTPLQCFEHPKQHPDTASAFGYLSTFLGCRSSVKQTLLRAGTHHFIACVPGSCTYSLESPWNALFPRITSKMRAFLYNRSQQHPAPRATGSGLQPHQKAFRLPTPVGQMQGVVPVLCVILHVSHSSPMGAASNQWGNEPGLGSWGREKWQQFRCSFQLPSPGAALLQLKSALTPQPGNGELGKEVLMWVAAAQPWHGCRQHPLTTDPAKATQHTLD